MTDYVFVCLLAEYKDTKLCPKIEAMACGTYHKRTSHGFIVVNRHKGELNNISSWNDDAWLLDAWSGIILNVEQIKKMRLKKFYNQYPMLGYIKDYIVVSYDNEKNTLRKVGKKSSMVR